MNPTMEETMTIEAYTNGKALLFTQRNLPPVIDVVPAITDLGPKQLQYLLDRGWIDRRRVQRLADHERASAARMEMSV